MTETFTYRCGYGQTAPVCGIVSPTPYVQALFRNYSLHFSALHTNGERCGELRPRLCCPSKGLSGQNTVLGLYWPDMNTEGGVAICVLKIFPR